MQLTLQVGNAATVAQTIVARLPETLSQTAKTLYQALVEASLETAHAKGYSPSITHMTMHFPAEQLAAAVGVSRVTVWRWLPELKASGLVDWRTHKGTCRGQTHSTGTVWQVRLTPNRGSAARLSYDDLKHKWRPNFDAEVRAGRTSYRALKHTSLGTRDKPNIKAITAWTLPQVSQKPVKACVLSGRKPELECVLDVLKAPIQERNAAVRLGAEALAGALNDAGSVNWYQRLLWQLLRHHALTGEDHSYSVFLAAQRAAVDAREGFARRPGALFHSRLKGAEWFQAVMNAPPVSIGTRPAEA